MGKRRRNNGETLFPHLVSADVAFTGEMSCFQICVHATIKSRPETLVILQEHQDYESCGAFWYSV